MKDISEKEQAENALVGIPTQRVGTHISQAKKGIIPSHRSFPAWTHRFGMPGQGCGHQGTVLVIVGPMIISNKTVCEKQHNFKRASPLFVQSVMQITEEKKKNYKTELLEGNLVKILYLQNKSCLCPLSFLKNHMII